MIIVVTTIDGVTSYVNADKTNTVYVDPALKLIVFMYGVDDDYIEFRVDALDSDIAISQETYNYIVNQLNKWAGV